MSSEEERIALTNLANAEVFLFLTYWASQYGIIHQAPPPSPVPQSPSPDLRCEENLEAIELSLFIDDLSLELGVVELTHDEFEMYLEHMP